MRYLLALLAVWAVGMGSGTVQASEQEGVPRTFSYLGSDLVASRDRYRAGDKLTVTAVQVLMQQADKALNSENQSVVKKPFMPPSGDKHDYMSLSPYWWPDPAKPDGKPYIRKDGEVNPERHQYDQPALDKFTDEAETLALAYFFTGDEKYAEKAAEKIRVWYFDPATRMNPNCKYSQFVPGTDEMRGVGVMETNRMRRVIEADGLLAGSKSWTRSDHEQLQAWFSEYLEYILTSEQGKKERDAKNNHGTWYDVQAITFAEYLGDTDRAKRMLQELSIPRIKSQIEPDGSQPRELERTKAYDYCRYNLEAMVNLARIGERLGVDLWNYRTDDGRSIRGALDWLAPYAAGEKTWEEKQIYEPKMIETVRVYRLAANGYRDAKYEKVVEAARKRGKMEPGDRVDLVYPASGK